VIGNGESRIGINIEQLKLPTVGCNAILRHQGGSFGVL